MKSIQLLIAIILLSAGINSTAQKNTLTRDSKHDLRGISLRSTNEQSRPALPGIQHAEDIFFKNDGSFSRMLTDSKFLAPPIFNKSEITRKSFSSDITTNYIYKEKLDSIVYYYWYYEMEGVERYIYDIYGRMVEYEDETWDLEMGYQHNKEILNYDPDGKVISMIEYIWDDNFADWVPDYKMEFLYDPDGNDKFFMCI
jgi:hypothetical protein